MLKGCRSIFLTLFLTFPCHNYKKCILWRLLIGQSRCGRHVKAADYSHLSALCCTCMTHSSLGKLLPSWRCRGWHQILPDYRHYFKLPAIGIILSAFFFYRMVNFVFAEFPMYMYIPLKPSTEHITVKIFLISVKLTEI